MNLTLTKSCYAIDLILCPILSRSISIVSGYSSETPPKKPKSFKLSHRVKVYMLLHLCNVSMSIIKLYLCFNVSRKGEGIKLSRCIPNEFLVTAATKTHATIFFVLY